jgi:predicted house-cleaning NTP pyrophosphatase (Maf/HAM1 superfamily)
MSNMLCTLNDKEHQIVSSNLEQLRTTTTLFEASKTWMVGSEYLGEILTAVCVLENDKNIFSYLKYLKN